MRLIFLAFSFLVSTTSGKNLFVAPTGGSDAVTYANNAIGAPWATIGKCHQTAQAGDSCKYRGGTFTISTTIDNRITGNNGTAVNRISHAPYNGEAVTIIVGTGVTGEAIKIERPYTTWSGFTFQGGGFVFRIHDDGTDAKHTWIHDNFWTADTGGDNFAFVQVNQEQSRNARIWDNTIVGDGDVVGNDNSAGVIVFRCDSLVIRNNNISNFETGIYMKHGNELSTRASTDIRIEGNWVNACTRNEIMLNTQWAIVRNNIFRSTVTDEAFLLYEAGGRSTGDSNDISHNTIHCPTNKTCFAINWQTEANDFSTIGAVGNILHNNIFTRLTTIYQYNSSPHYTVMNYNLYSDSTIAFRTWDGANGQPKSFAQWKVFNGQDVNSVAGKPVFVGGLDPTTVSGFALSSGSPGENAGSDGLDMGAMVDSVGVGALDAIGGGGGSGLTLKKRIMRFFRMRRAR